MIRWLFFLGTEDYINQFSRNICNMQVSENMKVVMKSPVSQANVLKGNQNSCEGIVVHAVDSVLIPCSLPEGQFSKRTGLFPAPLRYIVHSD